MKRVISKISFVVLIIIPMVILLGNINTKGAQATETLNVEFGIESKETIEVGASTNYNNWSYNETGALYISIANMNVDKVYKLVISMDPIVYAPVKSLPYPSGASTSFVKNSSFKINGSETYNLNTYSGTITYTFNDTANKTIQIENFKLQLCYDNVLWHKIANKKINIEDDALVKVELIEGDNVLDSKSLNEVSSPNSYDNSFYSTLTLSSSDTMVYMPNPIIGRITDEIKFKFQITNSSAFIGQYYKKLTIELNVPKITLNGKDYYLQYDIDEFLVRCQFNTNLSKEHYSIEASEDKIYIEIDNFYFKSKGIVDAIFTFPQDNIFTENAAEYNFSGDFKVYINDDSNLAIRDTDFEATLNTIEEPVFEIFTIDEENTSADKTTYADIKMSDYVVIFGGLGLQNTGGESGRIKIRYDFDTKENPNYSILVTTLQMIPDYISTSFEVKYTLKDKNGNIIWFNSSGEIVPKGTEGAQDYWTCNVSNPYSNVTKKDKGHMILFHRGMLSIESHKDYYFKSIEYIHGGFATNELHWNVGSTKSYTNSVGSFWGYIKATSSGKKIYSTVSLFQENSEEAFIKETLTTRTTNTYDSSIGLKTPVLSDTAIEAGESFSLQGVIYVIDYPYSRCNVINREDSPLVIGVKLPIGVTINMSGTYVTDSKGLIDIPIINVSHTPIDDKNNLWILELEGGHEIGYATETITSLPNGTSVKFKIAFNTSLSTENSTIFIQTSVFVTSPGITNSVSGSKKYFRMPDIYDLNKNNKTTDYVGSFDSQKYSNLTIQIKDKIAQLDITDELTVNDTKSNTKNVSFNSSADIVSYNLNINCTSGGTAEDFVYFIPIVKKDSVIDNEIIFSKDYSFRLKELVKVSNSISDNGVKVLYGFDTDATFTKANSDQIIWYETLPDDKTLDDVTIIKVVATTNIIENGSISVVTVNMTYDGTSSEYISDAGMVNTWSSRGQYKYKIGDRTTLGLYSTSSNTIDIHYTFEKQVIELTTSTGNHSDNDGNDSYTISNLSVFKNSQNYKITSVTTYNALVTSVIDMEAKASLLTGGDANRTFAFYVTLDNNSKSDISIDNCNLGTVEGSKEYSLQFEIFNADVISDITTIRYIDIIIESDNGVTIPVRINIKRELTIIGNVSNSISAGKQYALLGTHESEIIISKDSAFTAQFSAENIIPDNYKARKVVFSNSLPKGSTIVLIDLTNTSDIKYYFYEIKDTETVVDLSLFNIIGSSSKYSVRTGNEAIVEKYLFIVDLADNNSILGGTQNSINISRTLNSGVDEATDDELKFIVEDERTYDLDSPNEVILGEEIEVTYTVSELTYSDSKYDDRKLAISITPVSTYPISDSSIEYNGNVYYLNSNNEFIIPLKDVQLSGTNKVKFIYNSKTIEENVGTGSLNIKLIASATASAEKPHLGEVLKETNILLKTNEKPALKVESMSNRWLQKEDLQEEVVIKYSFKNAAKVTLELQTKVGEGYATDSTLLEAINNSTVQSGGKFDVSNVTNLNLKFSELMSANNYQILFTLYDNNGKVILEVPYKFVVME